MKYMTTAYVLMMDVAGRYPLLRGGGEGSSNVGLLDWAATLPGAGRCPVKPWLVKRPSGP